MHRCWPRVWRLLAYTLRKRCGRVPIRRVHGAKTVKDFGHVRERSDWVSSEAAGAATAGRRSFCNAADWTAAAATLAAALCRATGAAWASAGLRPATGLSAPG